MIYFTYSTGSDGAGSCTTWFVSDHRFSSSDPVYLLYDAYTVVGTKTHLIINSNVTDRDKGIYLHGPTNRLSQNQKMKLWKTFCLVLFFFYEMAEIPSTAFLVIVCRLERRLFDFTPYFFLPKLGWCDYVTLVRFKCHKIHQ